MEIILVMIQEDKTECNGEIMFITAILANLKIIAKWMHSTRLLLHNWVHLAAPYLAKQQAAYITKHQ